MELPSPELPGSLYWLHTATLSLVRFNYGVPAYVRSDGLVHIQGWTHADLDIRCASREEGIATLTRWIHAQGGMPSWMKSAHMRKRATTSCRPDLFAAILAGGPLPGTCSIPRPSIAHEENRAERTLRPRGPSLSRLSFR